MDAIKKETPILNLAEKYTYWLIPKFTSITKEARFTPKQLGKIVIREGMTAQEKEVFTKIFYNREAILAWNFTEMRKVKREVASLQKIRIVDHKAWQVPGFQISKTLIFIVIDLL